MEGSSQFLSSSSSVILDASLGNNICDVGAFTGTDGQAVTGWTAYGTNTILYDSNTAKITRTSDASGGSSTGAYFSLNSTALSTSGLTVGKVYKATFDAKVNTGTVNLKWTTQSSLPFGAVGETHAYLNGANTRNENLTNTSFETRTAYFVAGLATSVYLYTSNMAEGQIIHIDNMEIREVVANGKAGTTAQHMKSYGFDYASSNEQSNLGTGFMYTCGLRGHHSYQLNKTSGRLVVGSGDANEYFTHTSLLNLGTTDIILLGNAGGEDTLGINVSTASATWTCAGFYYHLTASNKHLYYWNHGASGNASGSDGDASRTAGRIHTITGKVKILQGELRTGYISGSSHNGTGLNWGETHIYDGGKLECDQTNSTDDSNMEVDSTFDSMLVDSGGTLSLSPTTTFIDSEASSHAFRISGGGTLENNDGTVEIKTAGTTRLTMNGTGNVHNLTVNHGSCQLYLEGDTSTTIEGALVITLGTVITSTEGGASRNLIVTGAIDCAGNLTCGSSTVQCNGLRSTGGTVNLPDSSGGLTIKGTEFSGYGIHDTSGSGNLVHNGGTVTWDIGGLSTMNAKSTFNNITTATSSTDLRWFGTLTLAGGLTVAANTDVYEHASAGGNLTVSGDVIVSGKLGNSDAYSSYQFGSLTINSGGEYAATSGTTIVKSRTSGGYSWYAPTTGSIFTHNNGTVRFTLESWGGADETYVQGTNFYNLEFDANTSAREFRYDDLTDNSGLTVLNNLTITDGKVRFNQGGDSVTVYGTTTMEGGQYGNTGTAPSGTHNYNGLVIINGGTWKLSSGTNNMTGIRKFGGSLA